MYFMRAGKAVRIVAVGVLLLGGYLCFEYGTDLLLHPWAYGGLTGGGPVGTWQGAVEIPAVGAVPVLYRFHHEVYREDGPVLEGESSNCLPKQALHESTVTGRVSWLGGEVELWDSNMYGPWGSPGRFTCQVAKDRMACVMDFSREMPRGAEKVAKKAGITFTRAPIRFVLQRVEAGRTLRCTE